MWFQSIPMCWPFVRSRLALTSLLGFLLTFGLNGAEGRQPITHEALWLLKQVGAPVPSPDGRWLVVPVTEPAYDDKDEIADLWLVTSDGQTPPRRLTTAKGKESNPTWSPDGRQIAFSARREGDDAAQLYVLDLAGGEARRLPPTTLGARSPQWSPDGRWLLFQGSAYRTATNDAGNKLMEDERKKAKSKVRIYESFPVRRWDKWLDDQQTHVWIVPSDGSSPARDLLSGTALASGVGFRGVGDEGSSDTLQPEWAPDSQSIVITATTTFNESAHAQPVLSLYQVNLAGDEPRRLTPLDANYTNPSFSPDGRQLAFLANGTVGQVYYALDRLAVAKWPWDGSIKSLTSTFDRSVVGFAFAPDSRTLFFTAEDAGYIRIWSLPTAGGEPQLLTGKSGGVWQSLRIPPKPERTQLFGVWEAADRPGEVFRLDPGSPAPVRLTSFNVESAAKLDWEPLREFWFTNKLGRPIHSFLALPPGFSATGKYPLLVLIHGGHVGMWRDAITRRWNYHLLAQPGYVVLLTDYVGSTGYGEKFTRDILGDPLRGPADDLNAAADAAIARFAFLDATRQAAAGASYGGHLANWLEATTTRYRCLISHAGLASLYAQWSSSDAIYHRELMMGAPFWEKPQAWLEQSPATYARDFRTPMLLSVGENDFRVPLNNTLEMWSLLQRQQVPSRLLVWPDENHWIQKGENSRVFYQEVHGWLARWLKN